MLNTIIRIALLNRFIVTGLAALILVYGSITLNNLPIDVFPDLTKPMVTIMTEGHGRAPEEVETLITLPLENSLNGLPGLERIRSTSGIGLSVIYLEFSWDSDLYRSRQLVAERLQLVRDQLPKDTKPIMAPIASLMGQIQQIALSSKDESLTPIQIRTLADWSLRPRLMSIPGVAQVIAIGGGLKQYQILISAEKLNLYQLSIEDIDHSLSKISQNSTGGFLNKGTKELLVRNIGAVSRIEDIEKTVVGLHFGRSILISDIAQVKIGPRVKRGDGSFMGKPAVIMAIQKQPEADTVQVTEAIEKAINTLRPSLPTALSINTNVFKQSNFINSAIDGIISKLQFGTILVFVVLLVFLANLRMSLITLLAIPLSFFITFIVFRWFGLSVNTMTLGGLAIAIGELVDDSIVDVENIHRRLRENRLLDKPRNSLKVIYQASSEVRNSIVLATLIIAMVFLPLFNLTGLEGRLFTPLAISYLTALFASLLVSLTVTPVLSSFLLSNLKADPNRDTWLVRNLKALDRIILTRLINYPKITLGFVVLFFISSIVLIPFMGKDFLPKFNEGTAMIAVFGPPGISLQESNRIGLTAEKKIMEVPEVISVSRRTGRAEKDEHAMGVNVSEIDVDFKKEITRSRESILNDIRKRVSEIPGIGVNVGQPISHLIDHTMSGVSAQIAIKLFGDELSTLRAKAAEIKNTLKKTNGLVDLRVEQQGLIPQLKLYVLRDEAARFGIGSGEITHLLESAFNGHIVGQVIEKQKFFDLYYRFNESSRQSPEKMGNTVIKTMPDGRKVHVKDVADIYETQGPNEISRENAQRRIIVSANTSGRDLDSIIKEVERKISEKVQLPEGYYIVYGGQFKAQQEATQKIILFGILALLSIALLLYSHFKSLIIVGQIMLTIPFAFIGGILLLYFTEKTITVASLIGFITLCGIASRNSIMMISHYLFIMKYEGEQFTKSMIIRGSLERLVPVLMTATVASLALLPIVFAKGEPGSEILYPVALVIVGGLFSSTLLDIIVTPTVFYNYGKNAALNVTKETSSSLKEIIDE